ncbi:MAG: HD domain-containing protein [Microthrixaceae bacterium]
MSLDPLHRMQRFFRSVFSVSASQEQVAWAYEFLTESEQRLFMRMPSVDQAHCIGVAQAVSGHLSQVGLSEEDPAATWILAAALLHDVGKSVSGLGTYGRVVATISEALGGSDMGAHWAERGGMTRRVGLYLQYPQLGADLLSLASSDERVVAWAVQHHLPQEQWTLPIDCALLLQQADDGRLSRN